MSDTDVVIINILFISSPTGMFNSSALEVLIDRLMVSSMKRRLYIMNILTALVVISMPGINMKGNKNGSLEISLKYVAIHEVNKNMMNPMIANGISVPL